MTVAPLRGGNFSVRWMFSSRTAISLRREKLIQSAFSEIAHIFRLIYLNLFVCVVRRASVDIQILHKSTNSFPNASETGNALPKHPSRLNFWETEEGKSADERRRQREHRQTNPGHPREFQRSSQRRIISSTLSCIREEGRRTRSDSRLMRARFAGQTAPGRCGERERRKREIKDGSWKSWARYLGFNQQLLSVVFSLYY